MREAVIRVEPDNAASAAVAERAGYTLTRRIDDEHGLHDWYVRRLDGGDQRLAT